MKQNLGSYINEYRKQLEEGIIPKAYKGLMEYLSGLRLHFMNEYSGDFAVGSLYQGCMDYSYFAFTPKSLRSKSLKIVIILDHQKMRFEICLAGQNKLIQEQFWKLFRDNNWETYRIPPTPEDGIIRDILLLYPDFDDPGQLTRQIETGTLKFVEYVREILY